MNTINKLISKLLAHFPDTLFYIKQKDTKETIYIILLISETCNNLSLEARKNTTT